MKYEVIFRFSLLLLTLFLFHNIYAQNSIKGTVLDSSNSTILSFVNIAIKGQSGGTISNSEGEFVISISNQNLSDTLLFSHIGYKTSEIAVKDLKENISVKLSSRVVQLKEVKIYSRELSARNIIENVKKLFPVNHPNKPLKREIFLHTFTKTPFDKRNKLELLKSDFPNIDQSIISKLASQIPNEFVDYNDAIIDLYTTEDEFKIIPIQGISLQEGDQSQFIDKLETELSGLIEDFQNTISDKDVYYKFRTGILSSKIGNKSSEEGYEDYKSDDQNYIKIPSYYIKNEIAFLLKEYTFIDGDNMEFIQKPYLYTYEVLGLEYLDDEIVYKIGFQAKSKGLYKGQLFISSESFAVIQMDFEFIKGKKTDNIQLFGMGHAINFKKGKVIYEKYLNGYYPKYIYAEELESVSFERSFLFMKKKKRFLIDKELNEMKFDAKLYFDMNKNWELLVLDQNSFEPNTFKLIKEPKFMNFKKENSFSKEIWNDKTIISPSTELKSYQRK